MVAPSVSIGVCVRNEEDSIAKVVESICSQDFPHKDIEVIFVDDGSEDMTLSRILDSVSRIDARVRIYHTERRGLGPARNMVAQRASADYIIWLDAGVTLPRDFVRQQVDFMERNIAVGIGKPRYALYCGASLVGTLFSLGHLVHGSRLPGTAGSIYRVNAIRGVGGFDENISGAGEDLDAAHRIRIAGWLICDSNTVCYPDYKETWKALWRQHIWYGYGGHYLFRKNGLSLLRNSPFGGFLGGMLRARRVYALTRRRVAFYLPFVYAFQQVAWSLGFAKAKGKDYRPRSSGVLRKAPKSP